MSSREGRQLKKEHKVCLCFVLFLFKRNRNLNSGQMILEQLCVRRFFVWPLSILSNCKALSDNLAKSPTDCLVNAKPKTLTKYFVVTALYPVRFL